MERDWKSINNRLVRQGTILVDLRFLENRKEELVSMNDGKEGARFEYPDSLIQYAGTVRCMFRLPYRQTQGLLVGIARKVPELSAPCYTQIHRRFNKLPVRIKPRKSAARLWVAVDASGISVTNRGEWMRKIHRKGKIDECKGFLKIHVSVNFHTKELVAIEVTREDIGDNSMLKPVLIQTVENTHRTIDRLMADGAYDTYPNFEMCQDTGITPAIRIDDNAITRPPPDNFIQRNRPEPVRTLHAREQVFDREKWKKKHTVRPTLDSRNLFLRLQTPPWRIRHGTQLCKHAARVVLQSTTLQPTTLNPNQLSQQAQQATQLRNRAVDRKCLIEESGFNTFCVVFDGVFFFIKSVLSM